MLLHLNWLEMGNTRLLTASHLDLVSQEVSNLWRATTPDAVNISDNFSQREFAAGLQHLKPNKAPGPDSICSELILHAGAALKSWLREFLSSCLLRLKIPKIWRRALVVAIPKPAKPVGDPKSYRPISLLCVPYKILERLIYARVEPLMQPPAYDTVWHCNLTCKLLRLHPDKHMVRMIMELVRNQTSPLPSVTASKAGYAVLKTAFLRDPSCLPQSDNNRKKKLKS